MIGCFQYRTALFTFDFGNFGMISLRTYHIFYQIITGQARKDIKSERWAFENDMIILYELYKPKKSWFLQKHQNPCLRRETPWTPWQTGLHQYRNSLRASRDQRAVSDPLLTAKGTGHCVLSHREKASESQKWNFTESKSQKCDSVSDASLVPVVLGITSLAGAFQIYLK